MKNKDKQNKVSHFQARMYFILRRRVNKEREQKKEN